MGTDTNKRNNGRNLEETMGKLWRTERFIDRQPRTESTRIRSPEGHMDNTEQSKNRIGEVQLPNAQMGKGRITPL